MSLFGLPPTQDFPISEVLDVIQIQILCCLKKCGLLQWNNIQLWLLKILLCNACLKALIKYCVVLIFVGVYEWNIIPVQRYSKCKETGLANRIPAFWRTMNHDEQWIVML